MNSVEMIIILMLIIVGLIVMIGKLGVFRAVANSIQTIGQLAASHPVAAVIVAILGIIAVICGGVI